MPQQPFDFQDLLQLVELMKSTAQFSEFKLRANGIELELRRGPPPPRHDAPGAAAEPAPIRAEPAPSIAPPHREAPPSRETPPSAQPAAAVHAEGSVFVKAPMVGTVYLAPEPGAKPFVVVGQAVGADTPLCIVEVMKLMNSVSAGRKGVVSDILVDDAEAVEFGQALFVITPE